MNSRQKGKRGELEFVHFLKAHGIEARRGQQYAGGTDSPDVIAGGVLEPCHIEVKRREAGNPYDWLDQAKRDSPQYKIPVVAHKRNGKDWIAILDMNFFVQIMRSMYNAQLTK